MEGTQSNRTFRDWLSDALEAEGISRRGLARRIAEQHPEGANPSTTESARTTVRRILHGKLNPTQPTRDAIQQALGRDDAPRVDDEERDEPVTREMVLRKLDAYQRDFRLFRRILARGELL